MQVERKKQNKQQRRRDRRRRVITVEQLLSKPSTDEFQVARWVKTYFKMRPAEFLNTQAQYFSSSHLIDRLLDTGFAMGSCALFTDREEAADFLHLMLVHDFFHRVVKKDKFTLQLHPEQTFIDDPSELYVWAYEPLNLRNWSSLFLLYFFFVSVYIVHFWPEDVEKTPRNTFLVACTLFFIYMIMTLLRLALYYFVRWITYNNYEFMIMPNLCKTVPFQQSLWPLCHIKYTGNERMTLKFNYSLFNVVDFYRISLGAFVILVIFHILVCLYIVYIFLFESPESSII